MAVVHLGSVALKFCNHSKFYSDEQKPKITKISNYFSNSFYLITYNFDCRFHELIELDFAVILAIIVEVAHLAGLLR